MKILRKIAFIPSTLTDDIPTYTNDANNSNNVNCDSVMHDFEASGLPSSYKTDWDGAKYYVQNAETTVQKSTLLRNVYHIKSRSSPDKINIIRVQQNNRITCSCPRYRHCDICARSIFTASHTSKLELFLSNWKPSLKRMMDNVTPSRRMMDNVTPSRRMMDNVTPSRRMMNNATPSRRMMDNVTPSRRMMDNVTPSRRMMDNATPSRRMMDNVTPSRRMMDNVTPSRRMMDNVTPSNAGKKKNERTGRKRFKRSDRNIADYELSELVPNDVSFRVVFVSDTRSYKCHGCGGKYRDSASSPHPLPPPHMDILLAIKQHRRYSPAGKDIVKITKEQENCYYHPLMRCIRINHGIISEENILLAPGVMSRLGDVHKETLKNEFGISF